MYHSLTQGDAAVLATLYLQGDAERGEIVEAVTHVLMEAASLLGASLTTLSVERFGEQYAALQTMWLSALPTFHLSSTPF